MSKFKLRANRLARRAEERGEISNPAGDRCQNCGTKPRLLHKHHHDYARPLDVEWLCPACHSDRHRMPTDQLNRRPAFIVKRGRGVVPGKPLKIYIAPNSHLAEIAKRLKKEMTEESALVGCSTSEHAVRILLQIPGDERLKMSQAAKP